jgi:hypothetical protein
VRDNELPEWLFYHKRSPSPPGYNPAGRLNPQAALQSENNSWQTFTSIAQQKAKKTVIISKNLTHGYPQYHQVGGVVTALCNQQFDCIFWGEHDVIYVSWKVDSNLQKYVCIGQAWNRTTRLWREEFRCSEIKNIPRLPLNDLQPFRAEGGDFSTLIEEMKLSHLARDHCIDFTYDQIKQYRNHMQRSRCAYMQHNVIVAGNETTLTREITLLEPQTGVFDKDLLGNDDSVTVTSEMLTHKDFKAVIKQAENVNDLSLFQQSIIEEYLKSAKEKDYAYLLEEKAHWFVSNSPALAWLKQIIKRGEESFVRVVTNESIWRLAQSDLDFDEQLIEKWIELINTDEWMVFVSRQTDKPNVDDLLVWCKKDYLGIRKAVVNEEIGDWKFSLGEYLMDAEFKQIRAAVIDDEEKMFLDFLERTKALGWTVLAGKKIKHIETDYDQWFFVDNDISEYLFERIHYRDIDSVRYTPPVSPDDTVYALSILFSQLRLVHRIIALQRDDWALKIYQRHESGLQYFDEGIVKILLAGFQLVFDEWVEKTDYKSNLLDEPFTQCLVAHRILPRHGVKYTDTLDSFKNSFAELGKLYELERGDLAKPLHDALLPIMYAQDEALRKYIVYFSVHFKLSEYDYIERLCFLIQFFNAHIHGSSSDVMLSQLGSQFCDYLLEGQSIETLRKVVEPLKKENVSIFKDLCSKLFKCVPCDETLRLMTIFSVEDRLNSLSEDAGKWNIELIKHCLQDDYRKTHLYSTRKVHNAQLLDKALVSVEVLECCIKKKWNRIIEMIGLKLEKIENKMLAIKLCQMIVEYQPSLLSVATIEKLMDKSSTNDLYFINCVNHSGLNARTDDFLLDHSRTLRVAVEHYNQQIGFRQSTEIQFDEKRQSELTQLPVFEQVTTLSITSVYAFGELCSLQDLDKWFASFPNLHEVVFDLSVRDYFSSEVVNRLNFIIRAIYRFYTHDSRLGCYVRYPEIIHQYTHYDVIDMREPFTDELLVPERSRLRMVRYQFQFDYPVEGIGLFQRTNGDALKRKRVSRRTGKNCIEIDDRHFTTNGLSLSLDKEITVCLSPWCYLNPSRLQQLFEWLQTNQSKIIEFICDDQHVLLSLQCSYGEYYRFFWRYQRHAFWLYDVLSQTLIEDFSRPDASSLLLNFKVRKERLRLGYGSYDSPAVGYEFDYLIRDLSLIQAALEGGGCATSQIERALTIIQKISLHPPEKIKTFLISTLRLNRKFLSCVNQYYLSDVEFVKELISECKITLSSVVQHKNEAFLPGDYVDLVICAAHRDLYVLVEQTATFLADNKQRLVDEFKQSLWFIYDDIKIDTVHKKEQIAQEKSHKLMSHLVSHLDQDLRADYNYMLTLIEHDANFFKHASTELQNNKQFVLAALAILGEVYLHCPYEIKRDHDVVQLAVKSNSDIFYSLDPSLQTLSLAKTFLQNASHLKDAFKYIRDKITLDEEIVSLYFRLKKEREELENKKPLKLSNYIEKFLDLKNKIRAASLNDYSSRNTRPAIKTSGLEDSSYLYAGGASTSRKENLQASATTSKSTLIKKPLVEIQGNITASDRAQLKALLRMSQELIYSVKGDKLVYDVFDMGKAKSVQITSVRSDDVIRMRIHNWSLLHMTVHGHYVLPSLHPKQMCSHIQGGRIVSDNLGRWVFVADSTSEPVVTLCINKDDINAVSITALNYERVFSMKTSNESDSYRDQLIHDYFSGTLEDTSAPGLSYHAHNEIDRSCADRCYALLNYLRANSVDMTRIRYATNATHGFLLAQVDTTWMRVDLGGGGVAGYQYENVSPLEEKPVVDSRKSSSTYEKSDSNDYYRQLKHVLKCSVSSGLYMIPKEEWNRILNSYSPTGNLTKRKLRKSAVMTRLHALVADDGVYPLDQVVAALAPPAMFGLFKLPGANYQERFYLMMLRLLESKPVDDLLTTGSSDVVYSIACWFQGARDDLRASKKVKEKRGGESSLPKSKLKKTTQPLPSTVKQKKEADRVLGLAQNRVSTFFYRWKVRSRLPKHPRLVTQIRRFIQRQKIENIGLEKALEQMSVGNGSQLYVCPQSDQLVNHMLHTASTKDIPFYFINRPHRLRMYERCVRLQAENVKCTVALESDLVQALSDADAHSKKPFILFVHWDYLEESARVKLNTLLDDEPTLQGKPLPPNVTVVGLISKVPTDQSFLSRFSQVSQIKAMVLDHFFHLKSAELTRVVHLWDDDWQRGLLGRVFCHDNQLSWSKSGFILHLEAMKETDVPASVHFKVTNMSAEKRKEMEYYFKQWQCQGFIDYHSARISLPPSCRLSVSDAPFDFSVVNELAVTWLQQSSPGMISDAVMINSALFDQLLCRKEVSEGAYYEAPGWLQASDKKMLQLYITTELSLNQWASLFEQIREHNVVVTVVLAEHVNLPIQLASNVNIKSQKENELPVLVDGNKSSVTVTTDVDVTLARVVSHETHIIELDDLSFQDLFWGIRFEVNESFSGFEIEQSELLKLLQNPNAHVVLYGDYHPTFIQYLHPILMYHRVMLPKKNGTITIQARLDWVFECPNQIEAEDVFRQLQWLASPVKLEASSLKQPIVQEIVYSERSSAELIQTSEVGDQSESDAFIQQRRSALFGCLEKHLGCVMLGATGVGKTSLIQGLDSEKYDIYYDLEQIPTWSLVRSNKQFKILFIDESNLHENHFMQFASLFDPKRTRQEKCFYFKGRSYSLDKQCRVVFACNPESYGGGRLRQKLFQFFPVPHLEFMEFTVSYLYHALLFPLFDHLYQCEIYKPYDSYQECEEAFKQLCERCLSQYVTQTHDDFGVRQLQQAVMEACLPSPVFKESIETGYILTPSRKLLHHACFQFLQHQVQLSTIDELHKQVGLNALLITGDTGCGKSALIKHVILNSDYTSRYVKLDAGLPALQRKRALYDAFNTGQAVWIDELNTFSNDGVEQDLNSLLNGVHPLTGDVAKASGFCLIASINSSAERGRIPLSPALKDRFIVFEHSRLSPNDVRYIIDGKMSVYRDHYSGDQLERLLESLPYVLEYSTFTSRDLLRQLDEIVATFIGDDDPTLLKKPTF